MNLPDLVHAVHVCEGRQLVHAPQAAEVAGRDQAHELIAACENAREGGNARRGLFRAALVNAGLVDPDGGSRERPHGDIADGTSPRRLGNVLSSTHARRPSGMAEGT